MTREPRSWRVFALSVVLSDGEIPLDKLAKGGVHGGSGPKVAEELRL